ncbi:MAG: LysR family transcriptional regulator [Myxococcales bacterium]|nr:LysR family transcriptional regulator [Myxococcales bacterium]
MANSSVSAGDIGLRWDDLELILALARAGTLSAAGQQLGVNTSTVASRLDGLEARCGHLFDRSPGGLAPTELVAGLLPVAESIELSVADAQRVLEGRETKAEGIVRVTAPPGLASWFLAPMLPRLRARYPGVRIDLDASVGYADLTRRQADIALRIVRPQSGDLVALRLTEAESTIVAAPRLARRLVGLASLEAVDWISWGPELANLSESRWLAAQVPAEKVVLRTSSMDAQIQAARAGLGVMMLSRPLLSWVGMVEVELDQALARALPAFPRGELWLVGHRALRDVPRVRAVWDFIVGEGERLRE